MPSRTRTTRSQSSSSSEYSDSSDHSRSTAPTVHSDRPTFRKVYHTEPASYASNDWDETYFEDPYGRASVDTYASTVASEDELPEDCLAYEDSDYQQEIYPTTAVASTPPDFADFFPSTRRLCIKHDDATPDGNMNLRVDTEVQTSKGRAIDLTLFHLRMYDLKTRDFSLRRYCRDSGREVCHSTRKYTKPATGKRPALQRSMSHALSGFRSKSDSRSPSHASLKRQDSGYDSEHDEDDDELQNKMPPSRAASSIPLPTNTTKLEFSNYAHIDVKRRGAKTSKRYEFEYWGTKYAWKRISQRDGTGKEISYHLINLETSAPVAHIVPTPLTPAEQQDEEAKGGWVRPCSMWISDDSILSGLTDVAE